MENVGKTKFQLNIRINSPCAAKSGCEHIIYHSESFCGCQNFPHQVLEKLRRIAYGRLGDFDDSMTQIRLKLKCKWAFEINNILPVLFKLKRF